jgi:O-antigen/teichoic acid export membrane protein
MTDPKAAFKSVLWNHAGKLLEYLCIYLTSVLVARSLGVQGNGVYAGLISLSQLLLVLSSFGLETSLNKHIPQLDQDIHFQQTRFVLRRVLLIRTGVFLSTVVLFSIACSLLPFEFLGYARGYLWFLVVYTGLRSLVALFSMVLVAQFQTALNAKINLAIRTIELLAVGILLRSGISIEGLFVLFIATGLLHVAAYAFFSRGNWLGPERTSALSPVVLFGGLYWINATVDFVLGRHGDVLLLTNLLSDSSQASFYDVAFSIAQLAALLFTVGLGGITFATFARLAQSAPATMDRFYGFAIRVTSLLAIPAYAFLLFNAAPVITTLYSSKYAPAVALVPGMMAFRIVARLFGGGENAEYLLSKGRVSTIVVIGVIAAVTNVVLNVVLIPGMGAMGAVIASGAGNMVANGLGWTALRRISPQGLQWLFWLKLAMICSFVSFIGSILLPAPRTPLLVVYGCLYFSLVTLLLRIAKPLTHHDAAWLAQIDSRLASLIGKFTRHDPELASAEGPGAP